MKTRRRANRHIIIAFMLGIGLLTLLSGLMFIPQTSLTHTLKNNNLSANEKHANLQRKR